MEARHTLGPVQTLLDAIDQARLIDVSMPDLERIENAVRAISRDSNAALYDSAPSLLADRARLAAALRELIAAAADSTCLTAPITNARSALASLGGEAER